jgi:uncharacterized membrane protein HdeD (DUF308 family)
MMHTVLKYLFAVFFLIAALVHVYGLIYHNTNESNSSHIIHLLSYSVAMLTVVNPKKYYFAVYAIAAIYPFYYHLACAWQTYNEMGKLNPICILVVILMPLIGAWVYKIVKN